MPHPSTYRQLPDGGGVDYSHPEPWADQPGGLKHWNALMEQQILDLFDGPEPNPYIPSTADELATHLDEAAFHQREVNSRQVKDRQMELISTMAEDTGFASRWKKMGAVSHAYTRMEIPEVTLSRMTSGQGEGFLDLLAELTTSAESGEDLFVRQPQWEKWYGFELDDQIFPAAKAKRAWQDERRLIRALELLNFAGRVHYLETGGDEALEHDTRWKLGAEKRDDEANPAQAARVAAGLTDSTFKKGQKVCAGCFKTAREIYPKTFSNCSKCLDKAGREVPYCSRECQAANYSKGWRHKANCGEKLKDSTHVPTFSAPESTSDKPRLTPQLLEQVRALTDFDNSTFWYYARPRSSFRQPKRFSPLGLRTSNVDEKFMLQAHSKLMEEVRDAAIHQRDPTSIGILAGYLLENPEAMWEKPNAAPTSIHGMGEIEEETTPDQLKVPRDLLRQQLKDAFELSEERLVELLALGRKALEDPDKKILKGMWLTIKMLAPQKANRKAEIWMPEHQRKRFPGLFEQLTGQAASSSDRVEIVDRPMWEGAQTSGSRPKNRKTRRKHRDRALAAGSATAGDKSVEDGREEKELVEAVDLLGVD